MRYTHLLTITAIAVTTISAQAQETTASGNLANQTSWNALQALIAKTDGTARTAQITATDALTRIKKAEACGIQGMLYAPGAKGAVGDCLSITPVAGKSCTFNEKGKCGPQGCTIEYYNHTTDKWAKSSVPTNWKDGETYIFKLDYSVNNYAGGQCRNGTISYWYASH